MIQVLVAKLSTMESRGPLNSGMSGKPGDKTLSIVVVVGWDAQNKLSQK
jgi:hypothetical protein